MGVSTPRAVGAVSAVFCTKDVVFVLCALRLAVCMISFCVPFHDKGLPSFTTQGHQKQRGLHRLSRETVSFLFLLSFFFFWQERSETYTIFPPSYVPFFQEKDEEISRDLPFCFAARDAHTTRRGGFRENGDAY